MDHTTSTINIITERRSNGEYLGLHATILEDDKAQKNALLNFLPTDDPRDIIAMAILCSTIIGNVDFEPFVTDNRHAALTCHDDINTQPILAIDITEHIIAIHDDINGITAEFEWTHAHDALHVLKNIEENRTRTSRETIEKAIKPYPLIDILAHAYEKCLATEKDVVTLSDVLQEAGINDNDLYDMRAEITIDKDTPLNRL